MNAPNQLSFLPEDYLENKAQRRANAICAILFLVTMVTIGFAFTTGERSLRDMQKEHAAKFQEVTLAAKRIDQFKQLQDKQRTMARQAELSAALLEKVPRSLILAKITNSLPTGCSLTDLALTSTKHASQQQPAAPRTAFEAKQAKGNAIPEVAEAKVYDVTMKITGLAPTDTQVGELIQRLKVVPLFKDVNLIISDTQKDNDKKNGDGPEYRRFQIEMTLDPNVDASEMAETLTASAGLNK